MQAKGQRTVFQEFWSQPSPSPVPARSRPGPGQVPAQSLPRCWSLFFVCADSRCAPASHITLTPSPHGGGKSESLSQQLLYVIPTFLPGFQPWLHLPLGQSNGATHSRQTSFPLFPSMGREMPRPQLIDDKWSCGVDALDMRNALS